VKLVFRSGGEDREVRVETTPDGAAFVESGELSGEFRATPLGPGAFRMTGAGGSWRVRVDAADSARHVTILGEGHAVLEKGGGRPRRHEVPEGGLVSPMPGTVTEVHVSVGEEVANGQALLAVEAMKMEIAVTAPFAGTVTALHVAAGDPCDADQVLAEVEPVGSEE
jgi:biotin carboxyl carrier protein